MNIEEKLNQYLLNEEVYEFLDQAGYKISEYWNIHDFEKGLIGMVGLHLQEEDMDNLITEVEEAIRTKKPETWQKNYAWTLFKSPPKAWGSRGAPFAWNALARKVSSVKLPISRKQFRQILTEAALELNLPMSGSDEECRYFEEYSAGGMSSGIVGAHFVKEATDELCQRL